MKFERLEQTHASKTSQKGYRLFMAPDKIETVGWESVLEKHSNRINLTGSGGNAVRSWDSASVCARLWDRAMEADTWVRMTAMCREAALNQ